LLNTTAYCEGRKKTAESQLPLTVENIEY